MSGPPRRTAAHPRRRGGLLFEVLLALGLFMTAAAFCIGASRSVLGAIERGRRAGMATDLARAKMAELEAGLITIADLQEARDGISAVGSISSLSSDEPSTPLAETRWIVEVETSRTEFTYLTLVALTVREDRVAAGLDGLGASFTLRQLVALRDARAEPYEEDEMLRDLPGSSEGGRP